MPAQPSIRFSATEVERVRAADSAGHDTQWLLMSGLPGKMAAEVAALAAETAGVALHPFALSSPTKKGAIHRAGETRIRLIGGECDSLELPVGTIAIDYSTPDVATENAQWYVRQGIPFVMGTTGFDPGEVADLIAGSRISAVVAPNMAPPIVMIQAAMRWLATEFPGGCGQSKMQVRESHQQGKRDTSGTAKALVGSFQELGIDFDVASIVRIRDPEQQQAGLGIPLRHLGAHAFHRYDIHCADDTVNLVLEHNVVGRRVYAEGTLLAVNYLKHQLAADRLGQMFTMEDVLRGN